MEKFKLGKKPARPGAVALKLSDYMDLTKLPDPPANFGHWDMVKQPFGMLGNDQYGDCFWAGSCHEHMVWGAEGGHKVSFTTAGALNAYGAATGFNKNDPNSDQGTDMQQGAKFRQQHGIVDANGVTHKISAYLGLEKGNLKQQLTAAWIFGAVGLGAEMPNTAESQFDKNQPWDVVPGAKIDGGHYFPLLGRSGGVNYISTWGRGNQPMTDAFFNRYNDESIVYLSDEILMGGKTIEGFDLKQLQADLKAVLGV